jgi:sulfur carrier protein
VKLIVNGEEHELAGPVTVTALVAHMAADGGRGVAVAVDAEVVPRSRWDDTELGEGQKVEILAAIQGG